MSTTKTLGQIGYESYGEAAGMKTFDGRPMPTWEDLQKTETGLETCRRWHVSAGAISAAVLADRGSLDADEAREGHVITLKVTADVEEAKAAIQDLTKLAREARASMDATIMAACGVGGVGGVSKGWGAGGGGAAIVATQFDTDLVRDLRKILQASDGEDIREAAKRAMRSGA